MPVDVHGESAGSTAAIRHALSRRHDEAWQAPGRTARSRAGSTLARATAQQPEDQGEVSPPGYSPGSAMRR
ncbi:MAG TPA: hypothetical protein VHJ18_24200 [Streptosporangiaceae bacterium]|nr:hypothetical protein [Streptosporangiaceae bacterium]